VVSEWKKLKRGGNQGPLPKKRGKSSTKERGSLPSSLGRGPSPCSSEKKEMIGVGPRRGGSLLRLGDISMQRRTFSVKERVQNGKKEERICAIAREKERGLLTSLGRGEVGTRHR